MEEILTVMVSTPGETQTGRNEREEATVAVFEDWNCASRGSSNALIRAGWCSRGVMRRW